MSVRNQIDRITGAVSEQNGLIGQLKSAIAENVSKTTAEVDAQAGLIEQIKTALEGKAGGGGAFTPTETVIASGGTNAQVVGNMFLDLCADTENMVIWRWKGELNTSTPNNQCTWMVIYRPLRTGAYIRCRSGAESIFVSSLGSAYDLVVNIGDVFEKWVVA